MFAPTFSNIFLVFSNSSIGVTFTLATITVLSTLVASLNYFVYGDNEDMPLLNCIMSCVDDADEKCRDIENINKFSVLLYKIKVF